MYILTVLNRNIYFWLCYNYSSMQYPLGSAQPYLIIHCLSHLISLPTMTRRYFAGKQLLANLIRYPFRWVKYEINFIQHGKMISFIDIKRSAFSSTLPGRPASIAIVVSALLGHYTLCKLGLL